MRMRQCLIRLVKGVFLTSHIATASPAERQCGLEILHRAAPEESASAKDAFPARPVLDGSGQGALQKLTRSFVMQLVKKTPARAEPSLFYSSYSWDDTLGKTENNFNRALLFSPSQLHSLLCILIVKTFNVPARPPTRIRQNSRRRLSRRLRPRG